MTYQLSLPGIVQSENPTIERYTYSNQGQNQIFTLNLSTVPVTQFGNYGLLINGSLVTYVYPGSGSTIDLVSGLANFLNNYGFFWATVTNSTTITLTARTVGTNYSLAPGINLTSATITQTQPGIQPQPLTPGTLVFYDIRRDLTLAPNDHGWITTYDQVQAVSGFNLQKHCAGVVVADEENVGYAKNTVNSNIRVLRNGIITYRNYGTQLDRLKSFSFNGNAPTQLLPGGAIGGGLSISAGSLDNRLLPTSRTLNQQIGTIRVQLG